MHRPGSKTPPNADRNDYPGWERVVGKFRWHRRYGDIPATIRQFPNGKFRFKAGGNHMAGYGFEGASFIETEKAVKVWLRQACIDAIDVIDGFAPEPKE